MAEYNNYHAQPTQPPQPAQPAQLFSPAQPQVATATVAPECKCGHPAIQKVSNSAANPGESFWTCSLGDSANWKDKCNFFGWVRAEKQAELKRKMDDGRRAKDDLAGRVAALEAQVKNLTTVVFPGQINVATQLNG